MKLTLRNFGLLILASLAVSGVGASAAQAVEFHTESGKATITGAYPAELPSEEEIFVFTTNNGILPCWGATFHGAMPGEKESTLTLTPAFTECFGFPVTMGACDFVLHASGGFDIGGGTSCAEKPMEINRGCKIKIGPQSHSGISYVNNGSKAQRDVTATFSVTEIHYTQTGSTCIPGSGTFNNGKLKGITTLRADKTEGGAQEGLWVE